MFKKTTILALLITAMMSSISGAYAHTESVIGADNRTEVVDMAPAPYRYIGKLVTDGDEPGYYFVCTASLIGPDLVITNAHCAFNSKTKEPRKKLRFYPKYNKDKANLYSDATIQSYGTNEPSREPAKDWAILRLKSKFGNTYGYFGTKSFPDEELRGFKIETAGYPTDFLDGEKMSENKSCKIDFVKSNIDILSHDCDTAGGASGSPLYTKRPSGYYIVGMHARGALVQGIKDSDIENHNSGIPAFTFLRSIRDAIEIKKDSYAMIHVCNQQPKTIRFAHSRINGFTYYENMWITKGWYSLPSRSCIEIESGFATVGSAYLKIEGLLNANKKEFCIDSNVHTIKHSDAKVCSKGFKSKFTHELKVSPEKPSITVFK